MRFRLAGVLILILLLAPATLSGYGVLSHEELIDIAWNSDIKPALLKRYPNATAREIQDAHAYAYGGSVIQDLGYYPFGNHHFTNFLHYVRSGEFVENVFRNAHTLNELAFAFGALSHYVGDCNGHPAVNRSVAIEYPNLSARFGKIVTYENKPEAHLKTEFGFDVEQVAKQRYTAQQYHDFVGFEVSEELLEKAFSETYGFSLLDFLHFEDLTIDTYRFGLSKVIPEMTKVAIANHKPASLPEKKDQARSLFLYHLSRADYEREFGKKYEKPGIFARILAWILKVIPKVGPFKSVKYRDPTPQTDDLYFRSMDKAVAEYHVRVQEANAGNLHLPERNLDTGASTKAGEYGLADLSYAELARRLAHGHFVHLTPSLRQDVLSFFASGPAQHGVNKKEWLETDKALAELKDFKPASSAESGSKKRTAPAPSQSNPRP
jgi:hypothetical protein